MYKYSYKAINIDGKEVKGTLLAEDNSAFLKLMREQDLKCYSYRILNRSTSTSFRRMKVPDMVAFSRQLSSMLVAGLPLAMSIEMLYERTPKGNGQMKKILGRLLESVKKGEQLSEALEQMGDAFPPLYISMLKSGELSGQIDSALVKLAEHFEKEQKQRNLIKSATNYPKILMGIILLVVFVLLKFVMPNMVSAMPAKDLPKATKFLLSIKNFIGANWFLIILFIGVLFMLNKMSKKVASIQVARGQLVPKLPRVGKMMKSRYTSQFASNLATLYSVGVGLLEAITMSAEIINNAYIQKKIRYAVLEIKKGSSIADAIGGIDAFDPLLTTMIFVGEQSGSIEDVLQQTADYFDEEANTAIKGLTAMISPIMMIVMAVIVGFVLIAIMGPMTSMQKQAAAAGEV